MCRPIKTEGSPRVKGERPSLHLQIPPPSCASLSTPSQPSSAESPFPLPPDSASSSGTAFFPDGPLKTPGSADPRADPFSRLLPQSPHPSTPYSQPSSSPLQAAGAGYPSLSHPGVPQGCSPGPNATDLQPGAPGTPRRAQQVDPFIRPQQHPLELAESPLLPPPHAPHYGDLARAQQPMVRQEHGSAPSPSAASSSPAGQYRGDFVPSPRSSAGRQDPGSGSPAGSLDPGDGLFKAPMTPRAHQGDSANGTGFLPPCASPNHPSESYRQSPSAPFSDPYAQPPLTPRPHSRDGCSPLPQRTPQQDPYSRVPSSPQSQGSSHSPLTPGGLSNDGFSVQSPATPRFQSPDPYSRPPSRPHSRDPFAALHKPPRPASAAPDGSPTFRGPAHLGPQPPVSSPSPALGDPLSGKPQGPPVFSRSPGTGAGMCPVAQSPLPQTQTQPAPQAPPLAMSVDGFPSRMPPPHGPQASSDPLRSQEVPHAAIVPGMQELPELSVAQDPALMGLSQSELEKHRQVSFFFGFTLMINDGKFQAQGCLACC